MKPRNTKQWMSAAFLCLVPLWGMAQESAPAKGRAVPVSEAVTQQFEVVSTHPAVKKALEQIKAEDARTLAEQKEIVRIEAPPFKETVRAQDFLQRLKNIGFTNAYIDKEGNVIAPRPGKGNGPKVVISAHLDTVFPSGTDLTIKEKDGKLYAPGISDDTRGLAELLTIARAVNDNQIQTVGDIWFVATVGEEGLGDLRGVKALLRDNPDVDGFISIDGARPERITYIAVGSRRFRVSFKGPGGHSFQTFGRPSAIHAAGRAIAKIGDIVPPQEPKTTFTVGTMQGGTTVTAIAAESVFELDLRSVGMQPLLELEQATMKAIHSAVAEENARWNSQAITVDIKKIGDRPGGSQALDSPIVGAAILSVRAMNMAPILEQPGGTDANAPISLGIPALAVGRGGLSGGMHSADEWFDPRNAYMGPQKTLLLTLTLVGLDAASSPVLQKRSTP